PQLREPLPLRCVCHQFLEPLQTGLVLLGADDPPAHHFPVGGGLLLKELPRELTLLQQAIVRRWQVYASLLIGIDAGLVELPRLVGAAPGRVHQSLRDQRPGTFDVDAAPYAAALARREANGVARTIDALADAIDPAKAKCLVHGLRPGNTRRAGALL